MVPAQGHLRRELPRPTAVGVVGNQPKFAAVERVPGAEAVGDVDLGAGRDRADQRDELLLHRHVVGEVVVAVAGDHVQFEGPPAAAVAAQAASAAAIPAVRADAAAIPATQVVAEVEAGRLEIVRGVGDHPAGKQAGIGHQLRIWAVAGWVRVGVEEGPGEHGIAVGQAVLEAVREPPQVEVISFDAPRVATVQPHAQGDVAAGAGMVFGRVPPKSTVGLSPGDRRGPRYVRRAGGHQGRQVGPLRPPQEIVGLKPESPGRAATPIAAGHDVLAIIRSAMGVTDV